jgi:predicted glutamine amidotransferase
MCGICGVASEFLGQSEVKKYMELMHLSVLRGWEGSGTVFVDEGKNLRTRTIRSMANGTQLILSQKFSAIARDGRKQLLLGHTRFPTRGKKILENIHPHTFGHIVGVHNGTFKQVNGKHLWGSDRSDSSLIFEDIATRGFNEAIKTCEGAYAMVWMDTKERTLNFIRNDERPLWFARTKSEGTMYWASDKDYLTTVLNDVEITELVPHQHVIYDMPFEAKVLPASSEKKEPDEPEWKKNQKNWEHHPWKNWGGAYGAEDEKSILRRNTRGVDRHFPSRNFNHANAANHNGHQRISPPVLGRVIKESLSERTDDLMETAKGYWCYPSRILSYLDSGCVFCGEKIPVEDFKNKEVVWGSFNEPICKECWTHTDIHASILHQFPNLLERKVM